MVKSRQFRFLIWWKARKISDSGKLYSLVLSFEVGLSDESLNTSEYSLAKNIQVVDKETQTELIESRQLDDLLKHSPLLLPKENACVEDAPLQPEYSLLLPTEDTLLHPITCSLCKHKYHYCYQNKVTQLWNKCANKVCYWVVVL